MQEVPNVPATKASCDNKVGVQSMTLPRRCTVSLGLDELTSSAACTKSKLSPSSSIALRQSSELEGGGNSESIMEIKEDVGVDSASSGKEQHALIL